MKKLLIIPLLLAAVAVIAMASGWDNTSSTSGAGSGLGTYDSLYSIFYIRGPRAYLDSIFVPGAADSTIIRPGSIRSDTAHVNFLKAQAGAAITVNPTDTLKGAAKMSAARFTSTVGPDSGASATYTGLVEADTFYTTRTIGGVNSWCGLKSGITAGSNGLVGSDSIAGSSRATGTFFFSVNAGGWYTYSLLGSANFYSTGYITSSGGNIYTTKVGGKVYGDTVYAQKRIKAGITYMDSASGIVSADTGKFNHLCVAKDTCLEVALFTRTCTRDTLAYMTGADSLTSAYIVSPFATRGAITIPPYIAGIVGGKLVVDRPAADTASFDRYSVTKIKQR